MSKTILVVDDEESVRDSIVGVLSDEGYEVMSASDAESTFLAIEKKEPDVVFLDVWMTGPNGERQQEGLDILARIKNQYPDVVVVVISGHGTIETAVKATKLGAYDFLEKPLSIEKMLVTLQNALQIRDLHKENKNLRSRVFKSRVMIAESEVMQVLKNSIKKVAPTNASVLITGENGTGKELVARLIHSLSNRYDKSFIEVNCAAIPDELIESELFGHEKGAFTGAAQAKRGKFDLANGGTLFLDEIGDMSLKTQAKILRILQEQRFERVGGSQTIEVDVRIIAATNKNLDFEIKRGNFREDLYYRLNVVPIHVPPLRERKQDINPLVQFFLKEFAPPGTEPKVMSSEALKILNSYDWPGNVRELKNIIERVVIFSDEQVVTAETLIELSPDLVKPVSSNSSFNVSASIAIPSALTSANTALSLKDAKSEFEKEFIMMKLKENDWNISKTAAALGVERSHLHKKIKAYGIETSEDK
jgi:two-component system nitrogen regulation response regulator NtrX